MENRTVVVVSGAGRGIGRAVAEHLSESHAVVGIDLDEAALAWMAGHLRGDRLLPFAGDASDDKIIAQAADLAQAQGRLVGWVNNAALFHDADLHGVPSQVMMQLVATNLAPVMAGCREAVRRFLDQDGLERGAIVNISSHQAVRPVPGAAAYATAKAAIEGLTRAVAVDYGPSGIRCNAVAPGSIRSERSDAVQATLPEIERRRINEAIAAVQPLGRMGLAAEVADAVAYLLSPGARFISGCVLPLDGGRAARGHDPEERDPVSRPALWSGGAS